jgi:hypothetical protein
MLTIRTRKEEPKNSDGVSEENDKPKGRTRTLGPSPRAQ